MSSRTTRRVTIAGLVGAIAFAGLLPMGSAGAVTNTIQVTGQVGNLPDPGKTSIMFIPTSASAKSVRVVQTGTLTGNFAFKVPRQQIPGGSLHLIRRGRYLAPITLTYAAGQGYMRFAAIPATATTVQLPKATVRSAAGYATFSPKLATARVDQTHAVSVDAVGKPRGAGRLGFVRKLPSGSGVQAFAAPCATSTSSDAGAGGDCDADGVPNAVDVDDNGNLTLDMTDPLSANSTAKLNPWTSMGFGMSNTLNANVGPGLNTETIAAAIGGENTFQVYFFVGQPYLTQSNTPLDAVWVDCAQIPWCQAGNGHAQIGGVSETPNFPNGSMPVTETLWEDYHGQSWTGGSHTDFPDSYPTNALFRMDQNGGSTWVAAVQPRNGDRALAEVVPGQVFRLRYRTGPTAIASERPMILNPFAVSVPALKSYQVNGAPSATDIDYSVPNPDGNNGSSAIELGEESAVHLNFWRPQRLPIGDEVGFQDLGKLHYGVTLGLDGVTSGPEMGCSSAESAGYYSDLSSNFARTPDPDNEWAMNLWPLTDTRLDRPTSPDNVVGFTLDVRKCLAEQDTPVVIPDGGANVRVSLIATGEQLTGGANRATQSFVVHLDSLTG